MSRRTPVCFAALLVGSFLAGCGRSSLLDADNSFEGASSSASGAGGAGGEAGAGGKGGAGGAGGKGGAGGEAGAGGAGGEAGAGGKGGAGGEAGAGGGTGGSGGVGGCAEPEVCDGRDNDCDGVVDEGNPGGGISCITGSPGVCNRGVTACQSGVVRCQPLVTPTAELCNGVDDDCDGAVDDGIVLCGCQNTDFAGHTYLFCSMERRWLGALGMCVSVGYNLVSIGDAAEDTFVFETANTISHDRWWIGLTDVAREGVFFWSNGSGVTYTNWAPGEPNDAGNEDCAQINRFYPDDTWNDERCSNRLFFICEEPTADP
jgi:hypothetical protein